ncbi:hypothetical protein Y027_5092 [Burkholderia pseudomallei TSV5]|nr:hypothetical protein Y027_5092 [Burkholderia pseudomallei TSV5]
MNRLLQPIREIWQAALMRQSRRLAHWFSIKQTIRDCGMKTQAGQRTTGRTAKHSHARTRTQIRLFRLDILLASMIDAPIIQEIMSTKPPALIILLFTTKTIQWPTNSPRRITKMAALTHLGGQSAL